MSKRKHYKKSQIIEYWFSNDGFKRMFKEHKDLACRLEYDIPHCFACNRTMIDLDNKKYKDLKNTSKNWDITSNLEKCHIIPFALGGNDDPSNLVLLCKECHKLNPNTKDEKLYWLWMKSVKDSWTEDMKNFKDMCKALNVDWLYYDNHKVEIEEIRDKIYKEGNEHLIVSSAGSSSMYNSPPNFTSCISVLAIAIKKHKDKSSSFDKQLSLF